MSSTNINIEVFTGYEFFYNKKLTKNENSKEQLLWERDLMGFYLSAHPLDKFDTYFTEQTHTFNYLTTDHNNSSIVVGGIITSVRNILTKSNTKMAFVQIENKSGEAEIIVFPSTFETCGAKLVIDNVIKVTGTITTSDKNGNLTSEVKIIAETVEIISDQVLEKYQPTGKTLPVPTKKTKKSPNHFYNKPFSSSKTPYKKSNKPSKSTSTKNPPVSPIAPPKDPRKERVYVLIENIDDTKTLTAIRRLADIYIGSQDIILVFKDGKTKRPLKMSFKVDANDSFLSRLRSLVGEDSVKLK